MANRKSHLLTRVARKDRDRAGFGLKNSSCSTDGFKMGPSTIPDHFYLYLWRSPDSPGTLYLAKGFETAEALSRGLTDDGYIVKVIHAATDTEFELCQGRLRPTSRHPTFQAASRQDPNPGMSTAFA
jgi:hypothetical protein